MDTTRKVIIFFAASLTWIIFLLAAYFPFAVNAASIVCSDLYNSSTIKGVWTFDNDNGNGELNSLNWSLNNDSYEDSPYNRALVLNGSNTYGVLSENTYMSNGSNVTFYFKVKLASDRPSYGRLLNQWLGGSNYAITLYNENDSFSTYQSADGSSVAGWTGVSGWSNYTNFDEFFYVVNGTTGQLYRNGSYVSSADPITSGIYNASTNWYLGASQDGGLNSYFKGSIDELAYWSGSASADEITQAYNASSCGGGGTTTTPLSANTALERFFEEYYNTLVGVGVSFLGLALLAGLWRGFVRPVTNTVKTRFKI